MIICGNRDLKGKMTDSQMRWTAKLCQTKFTVAPAEPRRRHRQAHKKMRNPHPTVGADLFAVYGMKLQSGLSFSSTAATQGRYCTVHVRHWPFPSKRASVGGQPVQPILTGNRGLCICLRTWGCPNRIQPLLPTNGAKRRKDCSRETRISTDGATAAANHYSAS